MSLLLIRNEVWPILRKMFSNTILAISLLTILWCVSVIFMQWYIYGDDARCFDISCFQ